MRGGLEMHELREARGNARSPRAATAHSNDLANKGFPDVQCLLRRYKTAAPKTAITIISYCHKQHLKGKIMPFENVSKRKLAFAPKTLVVRDDQPDFSIALHEINFTHTERISAPGRMIPIRGGGKAGEFEKIPELAHVEGNLSVPEGMTVLAAKLAKIDGDLHVAVGARFYAPLLEEVTGFIYIGDRSVVNAPKIEHMFSNDDTSKIQEQAKSDWLDSLAI
jgi:hypothetical protein